ncbi:15-hydroxyprostaglandin dehydrogenase [NAD(+)]-like [Actinia tenebrosa]|uniref:15-hydroxyprostaglandin dehydrogenase [NAD(+)] n=1 Tax=Actinia tenebrosa TaxID=6105 RepID=A0A6P8HAI3_ACTTE|nr:15-hydroxyprostaglandin dehydrogenase [NAD(+)]-like [Actinia tenebrosa]
MQIKGAVGLVTGAARGIGLAFCVALLDNGAATVRMLDICKEEGEKAQQQLEKQFGPGKAKFTECDVTNNEDFAKAVKQTVIEHGKLDILCNNAGIINEKNWEKCVSINLNSVIHGTFVGLETMSSGVIVNTASMGGLAPMSPTPVYCATKHGVVGFTRSIATVAMKTKGLRVNCICPAFVDTPLLEKQMEEIPVTKALVAHLGTVKTDLVAKGLIELITDDTKNGAVMRVTAKTNIDYQEFQIQGV